MEDYERKKRVVRTFEIDYEGQVSHGIRLERRGFGMVVAGACGGLFF